MTVQISTWLLTPAGAAVDSGVRAPSRVIVTHLVCMYIRNGKRITNVVFANKE